MPIRTDRRNFLRALGLGTGALVLPAWERAEAALTTDLQDVRSLTGPGRWTMLRERYFLDPEVTYLNHASIGTVPRAIHDAQVRYLALCETNPWLYVWGGAWEAAREEARAKAATHLGCAPDRLVLTHNTTEGFNLLATGLPLGPGDEVLFSSLNHDGASVSWRHAGARRGFAVREFDFPADLAAQLSAQEVVDLYTSRIGPRTRAIVLPHLDNSVGIRVDLAALTAAARGRGVEWVLVDGAQTVGMIPVDVTADGVDAYASSPHKWLQAPKGLGVLYLSDSLASQLEPMWVTWGQRRWEGSQRRFEDYGTRNLAEVLTLSDASDFHATITTAERNARLREIHSELRQRVEAADHLEWKSPPNWADGGSLIAIGLRSEPAAQASERLFGDHGIVLRPFETRRLNMLRVSPNTFNTSKDLDRLFQALDP